MPDGVVEDYGGPEHYHDRVQMYAWAYATLRSLGLAHGDIVLDLGAGYCDFDMYLRQQGWFGRYVPLDACIDPALDLETWTPPYEAQWIVALDVLEHLHEWRRLVGYAVEYATKGVVVSTADAATIDVLAMHPSHVSALRAVDLADAGLTVDTHDLGAYRQLVGWWRRQY